jgi:hypothetical protein
VLVIYDEDECPSMGGQQRARELFFITDAGFIIIDRGEDRGDGVADNISAGRIRIAALSRSSLARPVEVGKRL